MIDFDEVMNEARAAVRTTTDAAWLAMKAKWGERLAWEAWRHACKEADR